MTDDKERQLRQLREAVDRKAEAADAAARAHDDSGPPPHDLEQASQHSLEESGRPQDVGSVRDKNSGKGKKTADKWNQ